MSDIGRTAALLRMMMIVGLGLTMAGCAGSPLGDAIAGPEAVAAREAYCRSIGLKFGTPDYANCRMIANNQREQSHQAAIQRTASGLQQWGQSIQTSPPQAAPSPPRQCVSRRVLDQIVTDCQ
jgi:hypothetical protein